MNQDTVTGFMQTGHFFAAACAGSKALRSRKTDDKDPLICYTAKQYHHAFSARGMRHMESGESPGESVTVKPL